MTLIEMLTTITILALLASVALPISHVASKRGREMELRDTLRALRTAIDLFRLEWSRDGEILLGQVCVKSKLTCKDVTGRTGYPKSWDVLLKVALTGNEAAVKEKAFRRYLRKVPKDPITGQPDWRLRCHSDPPDAERWCGEDIYDVSSRSDAIALDGTKYKDW
ncbi:type II secretion system protein [Nitrospira sp. Nam80]